MAEAQQQKNREKARENKVEVENTDALKQALEKERSKAEAYLSGWQRIQTDMIRYRNRVENERVEWHNFANADLILKVLPILDDFERGFIFLPTDLRGEDWIDEIVKIYHKLQSVLETEGVSAINAQGEAFDPRFHEAVMRDEGEEGIITKELRKGYIMKGRVLRPSLVAVGMGLSQK